MLQKIPQNITILFLRKLIAVKLIDVLCYIFVQKSISEPDISHQPHHKSQGKETTQLFIGIVNLSIQTPT